MDTTLILDQMDVRGRLPTEAIRAASANRASAAPIFVQAIERYLSAGGDSPSPDALFFIFHLLGDWREKSAYRPLARLLRRPGDEIDSILDGAITETSHRVMAAVFDGDPEPLYEVILDPGADEYVRSRMCETIAMVTLRGEMPRAEAARFLRACYFDLDPQDPEVECWVWHGWQSAIAMLGLVELKPLVEQAFARGLISDTWLSFRHFEQDLQEAIADPAGLFVRCDEFTLFGDTVQELSDWHCFRPKAPKTRERGNTLWRGLPDGPATNPFKDVGRNDPCPCGSGIKFKKCCLAVGPTALAV
jgi:hypothetical protein